MRGFFKKRASLAAALILLCFLVSLIPILYVSFFDHPAADDYGYAALVHHTFLNGGGFFGVIRAACSEVVSTYFTWQGTFSAVFLFSLQPAAFSPHLYFLTTFLMVGALTGSTVFFYETVLVRWLGCSKSHWIIVSFLTLFASIQFVPNKVEAFYWYNGSVFYTFFYSLALLLASLLIRVLLAQSVREKIILTVLSCLLAAVIGGGNYTTALVTTLVYILAAILILYNKKVSGKQYLLIPLLPLIMAFIISMAAPGNAVRAAAWTKYSLPPVKAIGLSLLCGFRYIGQWSALPQVVLFLFLTPLLYRAAQKCQWSFRKPLLVLFLAFCIFSSQITPPMYVEGGPGPGREIDIYYYSYYILIIFCIFYLCGWMERKYPENLSMAKIRQAVHNEFVPVALLFLVLFLSGCYGYKMINMTSVDTAKAAVKKSVDIYNAEYYDDLEKLQKEKDVCIIREVDAPDFFAPLSIEKSPEDWPNTAMAAFFGVRQVAKK